MEAVEWNNISVSFGERRVLKDFTGVLHWGEHLRITGPSGSGKTTFLRCLLGFVGYGGELKFGCDPRGDVAYVPQEPDFGADGRVRDFIGEVFSFRMNAGSRPDAGTVREGLVKLNLSESILDQAVSKLSGGEKARIAVLISIWLERKVILLDEPFAALDRETAVKTAAMLNDSGRTIVYTSHHDPVEGFATREVAL